MGRRSDHTREELKELIVKASQKIIEKQGVEGLTARRIAADIGYAPGTIYNSFASMDDLYLHINERTLDLLYDTLSSKACNDPKKNPIDNMKAMAALYMDFAQEYRPYWLMLFSHKLPEERGSVAWYQEKIDRLFEPLAELLGPFFNDKQSRQKAMAVRVLWASVHGLCLLHETASPLLVSSTKKNTAELADYLIDSFVSGIKNG